jgi:large subunit ribosomal protein L21
MFAVISAGGKQSRVTPGEILRIEKLEAAVGETVEITQVLMAGSGDSVKVGKPFLAGAKVTLEVVSHMLDKKKTIYKKLRRHGKRLKKGHRQRLTVVKVKDIVA